MCSTCSNTWAKTTTENMRMDAFYVMRDKNQSNITRKQEQNNNEVHNAKFGYRVREIEGTGGMRWICRQRTETKHYTDRKSKY